MPISRKDFERERTFDTDEEEVVTFFEKNKDNAYTLYEIANALGLLTTKGDAWLIHISADTVFFPLPIQKDLL